MTDFLIQTSEEHTMLTMTKLGDMIAIHTENRTIMVTTPMAEEIMKGLMAILKGGFSRALSETSLRMEEEALKRENHWRSLEGANPKPPRSDSPSIPKPELDLL